MTSDIIFQPLQFRSLTVKNRILRSNISGRFDNYDGSGTQARINWEQKFARGGVGAILSSHVPVTIGGRILPNYATIDCDERIPFWRRLGQHVHAYDCKYVLQLSHSGRQQDIGGVENHQPPLSATSRADDFHGLAGRAMTHTEIMRTIQHFADGARRARQAGLDGVELHAGNGYLFTQFLSSAINDRHDEYGGSLENRARFLLEVIHAIRREVGHDFHLQVKLNATDRNDALFFWKQRGNTLAESIQICKWAEQAGADALHVTTGSIFPHPRNPAGGFPLDTASALYGTMMASGSQTLRNYLLFRYRALRPLFRLLWNRTKGKVIEGILVEEARAIRAQVGIPVICTGGFQTASYIRNIIANGACDAVSIARGLVANNDLVHQFAQGRDRPHKPCTYCNRCLIHVLADPFGCYDVSRYDGDHEKMIGEVMSVFERGAYFEPQCAPAPQSVKQLPF
jgi:2,4-dienoyl-CoA reductase-like NADH-dependent reductase (Old Yellow Enzyme family)